MKIEAEGRERIIKNSNGHHVIIPKNKATQVKKLLKDECHDCIDKIVSELPVMADYAENGSLIPSRSIFTGPKDPPTKPTKEQYRSDIVKFYNGNLDTEGNFHHYSELPKGMTGANCINGVCSVIEDASPDVLSKKYTGNITFSDNASKEGFVKVDMSKGYEFFPGDQVRYTNTKSTYVRDHMHQAGIKEMAAGLNDSNRNDKIVGHTAMLMNENEDGTYVVANNSGRNSMSSKPMSKDELIDRLRKGEGRYSGADIWRYDPELAKKKNVVDKAEQARFNGNGVYASMYNDGDNAGFDGIDGINIQTLKPDGWFDGSMDDSDGAADLSKIYSKNFAKIGRHSDLKPDVLKSLMRRQIGIAAQETVFGSSTKYLAKKDLPDAVIKGFRPDRESDGWIEDYLDLNKEEVDRYGGRSNLRKVMLLEQRRAKKKRSRDYTNVKDAPSRGVFQQKGNTALGELLGYDIYDEYSSNILVGIGQVKSRLVVGRLLDKIAGDPKLEGQAMNSLILMMNNYRKAKVRYPDADEEKLLDIATLMHSKPGLAFNDRYMNFYYRNENPEINIGYLEKVKKYSKAFTKDKK